MELSAGNKILAVNTIGWDHANGLEAWLAKNLEEGTARFGWSRGDDSNLRDKKNDEQGNGFLLNINKGDYLVFTHLPKYGQVTIARVTEGYSFKDEDESYQDESLLEGKYDYNHGDYRHCIGVQKLYSFYRKNKDVPNSLQGNFTPIRRWQKVSSRDQFEEVLRKLESGTISKEEADDKSRFHDFVVGASKNIDDIGKELHKHHHSKNLEEPLIKCLEKALPSATINEKIDSHGLDAIIGYRDLPFSGMKEKLCAVQIKSYHGDVDNTQSIKDIRTAFEKGEKDDEPFDSGLIMMTGEVTAGFRKDLKKLRDEYPKKQIGLLEGNDLVLFVMRYHPYSLNDLG